jgi:hypothetical protein
MRSAACSMRSTNFVPEAKTEFLNIRLLPPRADSKKLMKSEADNARKYRSHSETRNYTSDEPLIVNTMRSFVPVGTGRSDRYSQSNGEFVIPKRSIVSKEMIYKKGPLPGHLIFPFNAA